MKMMWPNFSVQILTRGPTDLKAASPTPPAPKNTGDGAWRRHTNNFLDIIELCCKNA